MQVGQVFRILQDDVSWTHVLYPQGTHAHVLHACDTVAHLSSVCSFFVYSMWRATFLIHRPSHNVFGTEGISVCALAFDETDHACDRLAELSDFDGSAPIELMGGCKLADDTNALSTNAWNFSEYIMCSGSGAHGMFDACNK